MADARDYTIGCICALPEPEGVALRAFLDEKHDPPEIPAAYASSSNRPIYVTGTMGRHKVAIATLPEGSYGIASATSVIDDMVRSFPNLRCCLMVGIGGGAPHLPEHDIRLGDVVVSSPRNGVGGILQYDHGKAIQNQPFQNTQHLNEPPRYLMSAVGELVQRYELDDIPLQRMVDEAFAKNPKLKRKYRRPGASTDRLYRSDYVHVKSDKAGESIKARECLDLCGDDASNVVDRPRREEGPDDLMVHRGIIASGSALMRDATIRDKWATEKGVRCFEMEAAGLMNTFPCLVIRGICDYSDTHKSDDWRGFAAMMAAAYAKQVLSVLQPWTIQEMDKITTRDIQGIRDCVSNVEKHIEDARQTQSEADKAEKQAQLREHILQWLTKIDFTDRQNQIQRERQQGTGTWFLEAEEFLDWMHGKGKTLFCPGIPGAGKTHMASIVIHHLQSCETFSDPPAVAYIYCGYREQHTQETLVSSLARQLARLQRPIPPALEESYRNHDRNRTRPSLSELQSILCRVVNMYESCFIVIDALDECDESNGIRKDLLVTLKELRKSTRANILVTSRDIPIIRGYVEGGRQLRIRASDHDIEEYLHARIPQALPELIGNRYDALHREIKSSIRKAANGMFLLAKLHLGLLEGRTTSKQVRDALKRLPSGDHALEQAYAATMERISNQKEHRRNLAMETLCWVAFSRKPLTIQQLQHALAVEIGTKTLDEENITDETVIPSACVGLISIQTGHRWHNESQREVTLVHETTQAYFNQTRQRWFHGIEATLFNKCLTCLTYDDFRNGSASLGYAYLNRRARYDLHSYIAHNFSCYIESNEGDPQMREQLAKFFLGESVYSCIQALSGRLTSPAKGGMFYKWNGVHLATYYECGGVIPLLLERGLGVNQNDKATEPPLHIAVDRKALQCIHPFLSSTHVDCNAKDYRGLTALALACLSDCEDAVRLLLAGGVEPPLSEASPDAVDGATAPTLRKIDVNCIGNTGETPLMIACLRGFAGIVRLLLDAPGILYNLVDRRGRTALSHAIIGGHPGVVGQLLALPEIDYNRPDYDDRAPIDWAVNCNYPECTDMLLRKPGVVTSPSRRNFQARHTFVRALNSGQINIARKVSKKSEIAYTTPKQNASELLYYAMIGQPKKFMKALWDALDIEVNLVVKHYGGVALLCTTAKKVGEAMFEQLDSTGLWMDAGFTGSALSMAVENEDPNMVAVLLDYVKTTPDDWALDALVLAASLATPGMFTILKDKLSDWMNLHTGWKIECLSLVGYHPATLDAIIKAVQDHRSTNAVDSQQFSLGNRLWAAVDLVEIVSSASRDDINSTDDRGDTALHFAAKSDDTSAFQILLKLGGNVKAKDAEGLTVMECSMQARLEPRDGG